MNRLLTRISGVGALGVGVASNIIQLAALTRGWGADAAASWIAALSLSALVTAASLGYHNYSGNELTQKWNSDEKSIALVGSILKGLWVISLLEIVACLIIYFGDYWLIK